MILAKIVRLFFSLTGSLRGRLTLRVKLFRDRTPTGTGITPHRGCDKEKKKPFGHKRGKALSIRTSEPTLNQIAKILYTKVTHTIIALLKGLEYTLTFSIMHKKIIIGTKITISLTPIPLEVTIRNKLKHSRRYHSGTISNGVEKAFEQDIISKGQAIDKPNISTPKPYIRTANMYTISFGHAASP